MGSNVKATRLRCGGLKNPLGIDVTVPCLSWVCEGGVLQTAYEIQARSAGGKPVWSTGRVESADTQVSWGGVTLGSRDAICWRIRLWDESGTCGPWSNDATFELGLIEKNDWVASWVSADLVPQKKKRYPVDCFCRAFDATDIVSARLYASACGLYEIHLNAQRVGDVCLAPGITDYRKRVQYQAYDVTDLVCDGKNLIEAQLADGWYRGCVGAWGLRNQYGIQTKLLVQLELTDRAGNVTYVGTDAGWSWSNDGAIRFADNKDGEVVDARQTPSYQGRARVTAHSVVPSASNNVLVREHESFSPALVTTPSGKKVLDFGQNIAGYVSFSLEARAGQRVFLRFGEMLDANGEFTQKNIQVSNKKVTSPLQQVDYTCKEGRNDYKTTFAIFGFQYVLVETDVAFDPCDFTARAVYSSLERTGWFESSSALLDKFVECTAWSTKNNSCDLPTDCPTRERHGWSGDAQIFCSTASYLFDYDCFARKYLNDMYDFQTANGMLPQIAPAGGVDSYMRWMDGSSGWADAGVILPYVLWKRYGDREILSHYYDGMVRYASFIRRRCGKWTPISKRTGLKGEDRRYLVNKGQAYGEWAEPDDVHHMVWTDFCTTQPEVSTAYASYIFGLMAQIAVELGRDTDAQKFLLWSEKTRDSYRALIHKCPDYTLDTDRQAQLVRPLHLGLLDEKDAAFARGRLIRALENYGWRIGTGFLSTPFILYVLSSFDLDAAYRLLENEEMPGWLVMPKSGATTIWEGWEGSLAADGIASLDHYSKGAMVSWLFEVMCGINVAAPRRFNVAPRPGGAFSHAKASYMSAWGLIESGWELKQDGVTYTVTVPANCTATVSLPGRAPVAQGPGTKTYTTDAQEA